ncbi:Bug family tripartite tricarboxylate transporter substrate binding protein [Ideonella livida]|uniref:Tripartite tricarboxylate transporter substrate binding protein n=1 Tax=Ideonella livida TaxID=2707176 RepID=A0A7C9PH36_9BURK|nr:tripartite tricarboxylate transporter substrate binding protein [Ideonella livida]NDY91817.1 tripartite tricarboxylate transporter substrate binding protein [Ideonella livida]
MRADVDAVVDRRRRTLLAQGLSLGASAMAGAALLPGAAQAQAHYPAKPIRLVVPFPAGTSPDVVARQWAEHFAKFAGQAVVIENKPGAATIIATQAVAQAPADGYTLYWTVNNTFSINPFVYRKLPYKLEDFTPVQRILTVPLVLMTGADSKIRSVADLVREAKARPGALTYASAGIGTSLHVVLARLFNQLGISLTHVPYKDAFITDLAAGRIDVALDASTTAIGNLAGGRLRGLGLTSATPVDALPGLAPLALQVPGFEGTSWHGLFAPKGLPDDVLATLVSLSDKVMALPEFRAKLSGWGLLPAGGSPATFRQFLAEDARGWAKVVQDNQITVE